MNALMFVAVSAAMGIQALPQTEPDTARDSLGTEELHRIDDRLMVLDNALYEKNFWFNEQSRFLDAAVLPVDEVMDKVELKVEYAPGYLEYMEEHFPYYPSSEKIANQFLWSRDKWAAVRLGDRFGRPESGDMTADESDMAGFRDFREYMDNYFLRMDHVVDRKGNTLFEPGLLLHSHRGLRDYVKGMYSEESPYDRQAAVNTVIEKVLTGDVPLEFLRDTSVLWDPWNGRVWGIGKDGRERIEDTETEGNHRYEGLLSAMRCSMTGKDHIDRVFEDGTVTLGYVEGLIESFLSSPVLAELSGTVRENLGRDLEPFDIWYSGFQEQSYYSASWLDSLTRSRFPDPKAFNDSIAPILMNLGFSKEEAVYIRDHVKVRQVVSGGYSNQPASRDGFALLTTMFDDRGMDYKSYRVAMHELGHCVCGIYSTRDIDWFCLGGVPNGGITEGMAELFAYMNIRGLGLDPELPFDRRHMLAQAAAWYLYEMGGQALTEIRVWKWFAEHPDADALELREAVLSISAEVWNRYFSDNFSGIKDSHILSIYNHFITGDLYLHNYFLSNIIMFQIYNEVSEDLSEGLQRLCREGSTTLSRWMINGVGEDVTPAPIFEELRR